MTTWLSSTAPQHPGYPPREEEDALDDDPLVDPEHGYPSRGESVGQRLDRDYGEILQEVRVAQTGVHVLLAFLLTLAFTPKFGSFTELERNIYVACLVLGAASNALLIAPAPFHRLMAQRRLKRQLVRASGRFAFFGVTLLMLALTASLLLILEVVVDSQQSTWIAGGTLGWFALWWYVAPIWSRIRNRRRPTDEELGHGAHRRPAR
jgi:hypothetical protein